MYFTVFAQPLPQFLKVNCHKNYKQNATIFENNLRNSDIYSNFAADFNTLHSWNTFNAFQTCSCENA